MGLHNTLFFLVFLGIIAVLTAGAIADENGDSQKENVENIIQAAKRFNPFEKRFSPYEKRFDLYKRFDPFQKRFDPYTKRFDGYYI